MNWQTNMYSIIDIAEKNRSVHIYGLSVYEKMNLKCIIPVSMDLYSWTIGTKGLCQGCQKNDTIIKEAKNRAGKEILFGSRA